MTGEFYICAWSYDWEEGFDTFYTKEALIQFLQETFNIPESYKPFGKKFRNTATHHYELDDWKSFQILKVDSKTKTVKAVRM